MRPTKEKEPPPTPDHILLEHIYGLRLNPLLPMQGALDEAIRLIKEEQERKKKKGSGL